MGPIPYTQYPIRDTVFVGLSGGVDSAVSAALLKQAGHRVVGSFIKIWRPEFSECPWREDRLDAMRVAAALEIPFREVDLSDEYKKAVIDDMIAHYERGITPNPDVLCNRHIKFGAFAQWAFSEGADLIATGHYARIQGDALHSPRRRLLRGKDTNKDQSYFLWQLTKKDLERTFFPVGGLAKPDVRALAQKFGLPNAQKKDSQGLCFVGDVTMREFLGQLLPLEKGPVLNEQGQQIGEHDGAMLYTLGERHGFRLKTNSPEEAPQYVIGIDTQSNTIRTSPDKTLACVREVRLVHTNWLEEVIEDKKYAAQTRYREKPTLCTISNDCVVFDEPHLAPAGQSLVVYEGDQLVGGGIIAA